MLVLGAPAPDYDQDSCDKLANLLTSVSDLPAACLKYSAAVQKVQSKQDRLARGDAFSGMTAGAAVQARASKARGEQHFAQIQRRRTAGTKQFEKREKHVA